MTVADESTTALPTIRSYRPTDHEAVADLYSHGLLAGHHDSNDTAADLDYMADAYFSDPRDHFWVAELGGQVVGCVGVAHEEAIAQVRRLRVRRDLQSTGVGVALMDAALEHCRRHGFLKVVLDTHVDADRAITLLDQCGFQFARNKSIGGKEVLEFYFNLYRKIKPHEDRKAAPEPMGGRPSDEATGEPAGEAPHRIRVLLADDHEALRRGLIDLLGDESDIEVVGQATDGQEAVEMARRMEPDLVVMDVSMPKLTGIEATRLIARELPGTRVIGLSMHEKHEVATSMLEAGAIAYLPKDAPMQMLISAIRGEGRGAA